MFGHKTFILILRMSELLFELEFYKYELSFWDLKDNLNPLHEFSFKFNLNDLTLAKKAFSKFGCL